MATNTWRSIYVHLGYALGDIPNPLPTIPVPDELDSIAIYLDTIDTTLANANTDSMALQVGELKVDYNAHIALVKLEGTRLLGLLATLSGLAIVYNKYTGKKPLDVSSTPLVVRSLT